MITEWIITLASTVWAWFADLWPDWEAPAFLTTMDDQVNEILGNASGAAVWADWTYILIVVGVVLSTWALAFLVKIVLRIVAYIPFFGGAG